MSKVLKILKENAFKNNNISALNEDTSSSDINSAFDSMIGDLIKASIPKTIASSVCSVQPLKNGPDGYVFGTKRVVDPVTSEITIKVDRQKIHADFSKKFNANFTDEAVADFASFFNELESDLFLQASSAESALYVDSVIIPVLRNLAKPMAPVVLDGNPETAYFQMLYLIHLGLVDINRDVKRGISGFAILSPTLASIFSQFSTIYASHTPKKNPETDVTIGGENQRNVFFLGSTELVDFYVDPMAPNDEVIIGFKSEIEGETAVIFAPYLYTIYKTTNVETSNEHYYSLTRFGYARNPLDKGTGNHDSDFLRIFALDASSVGNTSGGAGNTLSNVINNYVRNDFVSLANQTSFTVTGIGNLSRLFVDGVYINSNTYTYTNPILTLSAGLPAGKHVSIETFSIS